MRCHFSSFSFFFNDKAHFTHISFFIQLLLMYFYILFLPYFFLHAFFLCIFPHRIYADSFFAMERGIKLEVSTILIGSGCPKYQATHLVHLFSFLLFCSMSTCSLNFDVQKPVVSLRRQVLSVPCYSHLTCHLPRLGDWIIVRWKWCYCCRFFPYVSLVLLWFLEGHFLILPKDDRVSRLPNSNQRLYGRTILTAEFNPVSEFLNLFWCWIHITWKVDIIEGKTLMR